MKVQKNPFQIVEKTMWDIQELNEKEADIQSHHAVECTVVGMQMVNSANVKNAVTGQTEAMIAITANILIPIDPRKINKGLLIPNGISTGFQKACPVAPTFRIVINEEFMSSSYIPAKVNKDDAPEPSFSIDDLLKKSGIE